MAVPPDLFQLECDAPAYSIVSGCRLIGFRSRKTFAGVVRPRLCPVRFAGWCVSSEEGLGRPLASVPRGIWSVLAAWWFTVASINSLSTPARGSATGSVSAAGVLPFTGKMPDWDWRFER